MSERDFDTQAGEIREVATEPEGSGPKDRTAPVQGGQLRPEIDWNRVLEQLPEATKAEAFERYQKSQPEYVRATRIARREHIRLWVTIVVFAAILIEAGAAVYIAAIAKTSSWDHVKDWLIISMAPFVAAATVTSTFWFPSREAE